MVDRDFKSGGGGVRGVVRDAFTVDVRHQRRAFGANGFYGNSPSREWTNQSLASLRWARSGARWTTESRVAVRIHGDHFRWDIARPGFAENRHRTNAVDASAQASRVVSPQVRITAGGGAGGDWITSSNLGDRTYARGHGFAEGQWMPGPRLSAQAGVRLDGYSTFGHAWSPSVSMAGWLSAARAFRIPRFTERFYTDPAHQASDVLSPETGTAAARGGRRADGRHGRLPQPGGWTAILAGRGTPQPEPEPPGGLSGGQQPAERIVPGGGWGPDAGTMDGGRSAGA